MRHLAIMNIEKTVCENLLEVDYGSFKDIYEKNESRLIEFDYYRSSDNHFLFQLMVCENYILYDSERFVIKQVSPKISEGIAYVSVTAYHIMYEFQNHFIEPSEVKLDGNEEDKKKYTLNQGLEKIFKNQRQSIKFEFKIIGEFTATYTLEEIYNQNGIEAIKFIADRYNCIIYPKDTLICFYNESSFYKQSEEIIRYKYNTNAINASVSTLELRTAVKAYGKKLTTEEVKNYSPIKPEGFTLTSDFQKEKTWGTEKIGGRATVTVNCKFGNETIRYTIKKGPNGGLFTAYIDGEKIGTYSCWSKEIESKTIDLVKNVDKGTHQISLVFKGEDANHKPEKKKKARFLLGSKKTAVINLIADVKGDASYKAVTTYISPNSKLYGIKYASSLTNENISDKTKLEKWAKSQLQDTPKTELEVNYISENKLSPRDKVFFIHEMMGYNTELKVIRLERGHFYVKSIDVVAFSNSVKDMVQIQRALNRRMNKQDNQFKYQKQVIQKLQSESKLSPFTTRTVGSVIDDED